MEEYFQKLHESVKRLDALLSDPQPGLSSWCQAYGELVSEITDIMWLIKEKSQTTDVDSE